MILSNNNGTFTPVAGGTGTFIGTTAAFNAVKATLPDNTVAYITDDASGSSSYSTTETKTGETWIDGKPIYRKVASGTIPATLDSVTGWASVTIAIPNLDKVISLKFADCGYESINGMAEYVSDNGGQFKSFLYHGDVIVKTNVNSALSSSFNLIMEYTKTTD